MDIKVTKKRAKIFKSTNIVSDDLSRETIDEMNNFMANKNICSVESINGTTYVIYWEE